MKRVSRQNKQTGFQEGDRTNDSKHFEIHNMLRIYEWPLTFDLELEVVGGLERTISTQRMPASRAENDEGRVKIKERSHFRVLLYCRVKRGVDGENM